MMFVCVINILFISEVGNFNIEKWILLIFRITNKEIKYNKYYQFN